MVGVNVRADFSIRIVQFKIFPEHSAEVWIPVLVVIDDASIEVFTAAFHHGSETDNLRAGAAVDHDLQPAADHDLQPAVFFFQEKSCSTIDLILLSHPQPVSLKEMRGGVLILLVKPPQHEDGLPVLPSRSPYP